ncbi:MULTISPECIES: hypothetical protein [unclassified Clostridium]|uniref:hypothetical protein n=1 Tax=unclassified Clostridium TaxID=2614128 RepID=UPI00029834A4|nr:MULTISPECIES: hypothetical protein [unclassified Clostridium]EKQ52392.1 MAG: hypothetical protein A370_04225 [Clostridium sp. Maddingley MBC34-26]
MYDHEALQNRVINRNDITTMVTHLTKPLQEDIGDLSENDINMLAVDNLIKILNDQKIKGSTSKGFIIGKTPAVCFQDVPFYGMIQNVEHEKQRRKDEKDTKIRYCGVGLTFSKFYVFSKGGRPVMYEEKEKAKKILPVDQHWRIVNFHIQPFDPNIIDWTHEREWRMPGDFSFELDLVHILLYDKECWDYFFKKCDKSIIDKIHGVTILKGFLM